MNKPVVNGKASICQWDETTETEMMKMQFICTAGNIQALSKRLSW